MQKKAQAALEYLMTYGWALLLVVAVAAILFLLVSPSSGVGFSSSDQTKIMLKTGNIDRQGNVKIIAQNATGGAIKVTGFSLTGSFVGSTLNGTERTSISESNPATIPAGGEMRFEGILYAGTGSVDGTIEIQYSDFSGYSKTARITGKGTATPAGKPVPENKTISEPGTYILKENLSCTGDCITINASNVILNAAGKTISGNGTGNGITINGASNVSVSNAQVTNFSRGFNVVNSPNISLSNNIAKYNTVRGFYFTNSTGASFNNNASCCSGQHDIYCEQSLTYLTGTGNVGNAVYQCYATTSGCAQAGITC